MDNLNPDNSDVNEAILLEAARVVAAALPEAERQRARRRRLLTALRDLDLLDAFGGSASIVIGDTGLEIAALDDRNSDALVYRLEELASRRTQRVNRRGPGQLPFGH